MVDFVGVHLLGETWWKQSRWNLVRLPGAQGNGCHSRSTKRLVDRSLFLAIVLSACLGDPIAWEIGVVGWITMAFYRKHPCMVSACLTKERDSPGFAQRSREIDSTARGENMTC